MLGSPVGDGSRWWRIAQVSPPRDGARARMQVHPEPQALRASRAERSRVSSCAGPTSPGRRPTSISSQSTSSTPASTGGGPTGLFVAIGFLSCPSRRGSGIGSLRFRRRRSGAGIRTGPGRVRTGARAARCESVARSAPRAPRDLGDAHGPRRANRDAPRGGPDCRAHRAAPTAHRSSAAARPRSASSHEERLAALRALVDAKRHLGAVLETVTSAASETDASLGIGKLLDCPKDAAEGRSTKRRSAGSARRASIASRRRPRGSNARSDARRPTGAERRRG